MASITSATSGLASATSTWTGGVVPGTTFAGNRTTTGTLLAIGTTSIPVTSTGVVVTAGKWLAVAGDTTKYRVATGLAASTAGNIILDAPGLVQAIPASATTLSVDMVDDKVTIQHPGTNSPAAGTQYLLNGAHSAGAVTINVNTGTNTIVAGECIQFEHQIGTDEDGQPIYDNTYYKVATTLTAGVIVISTGLAYAMASGVRVVNRGHVVEQDIPFAVWGDDTSSTTAASNAIEVRGALKASRSVSQTLVARGTIFYGSGGTIDYGVHGVDPIPAAVNAVCALNDSATLAAGKHVLTPHSSPNITFRVCGKTRARNTQLTSGISAGATSITVDDSTGWEIGDRIVVASDTNDPARAQVVVISGGSSPTWTVPAITNARISTTKIGNLSSNVVFKASSPNFPTCVAYFPSNINPSASKMRVRHARFDNSGNNTGWTGASQNRPIYYGSFGVSPQASEQVFVRSCATEATGTNVNAGGGPSAELASLYKNIFSDWAIYSGTGSNGVYFGDSTYSSLRSATIYRSSIAVQSAFGGGAIFGDMTDCYSWSSSKVLQLLTATGFLLSRGVHQTIGGVTLLGSGGAVCENVTFVGGTASQGLHSGQAAGSAGSAEHRFCTFSPAGILTSNTTTGSQPSQGQTVKVIAPNGDPADNRVLSYYQTTVTDLTTRKRSTYAVKIQPKVANTAITYTFALPAVAGVAQTIKGSLRFDGTYGTATPPRLDLSGQGVTQSYTCAAVADAWDDFALSFTPTSTGDITATVTVQSASTAGFAWLDGVYHYPMTQSVRHFGYVWQAQANQVADPSITVSEATALAYPVAVNHGTSTITVSGNATARQVYEACMADLVQTANQGTAKHISTSDNGVSFSTTYAITINTGVTVTGDFTTTGAVTLTGTAQVDGVYVSSAGTSTHLTLTGLSAAAVQILNNSGASHSYTASVTGTFTLNLPAGSTGTWTWKVAKYGSLSASATFTPGGSQSAAPSLGADTGITQPTQATVAAYTSLDSIDKQYDFLAHYETTSAGILLARLGTKAGAALDFGSKNIVYDAGAGSVLTYSAPTLTLKATTVAPGATFTEFTTTGSLTLTGATVTGIYTDDAGRHVRILASALPTGARVRIYDVTAASELFNDFLPGAGLDFPLVYPGAHTIQLRAALVGYLPIETSGAISAAGLSFLDALGTDAVYVENGVDGSTCTEFAPDYPNLQIEVTDPDNITSVQRTYAWTRWANWAAADGIRLMHNSVQAGDTANYSIDVAVVDAHFQNMNTAPLLVVGGYIRRSDGTTVIAAGGSIQMDPGKAYVASSIATQVNEIALVHGLVTGSPLEVTLTARTAGALSQTIGTVGDTTTVTRV